MTAEPLLHVRLVILDGPDAGTSCEHHVGTGLVLGRGSGCDLRLNDPSVSREHCKLVARGRSLAMLDLGSRWGTSLNDTPVAEQLLDHGDVIGLGDTRVRVELLAAPMATTIPPRGVSDEGEVVEGFEPHLETAVPSIDDHERERDTPAPPTAPEPPGPTSTLAWGSAEDVALRRERSAARDSERDITADADDVASDDRETTWARVESPPAGTPQPPVTRPQPPRPHRDPAASPPTSKARPSVPPPVAHLRDLVGHRIYRYELQDVIAEARTGMLFRAHDHEYDRPAAVKVLWPEVSRDESEVRRFIRAIKTMIHVKHPNLVSLYGAGKTGTYCWTACEFVDGESLDRVVERQGVARMIDWRLGFRVALGVARGLEAAHEHGVVHRNVTPTNVLLTREQHAKLGDLALAKAVGGTLVDRITRRGELVGELPFMAPEQVLGRDLDTRTDVYNLGATVYALLTGRPPFQGVGIAATTVAIRTEAVVPPTKFHLAIPPLFDQLVVQMLEKRPEDRPATPHRLVRELERIGRFNGVDLSGPATAG